MTNAPGTVLPRSLVSRSPAIGPSPFLIGLAQLFWRPGLAAMRIDFRIILQSPQLEGRTVALRGCPFNLSETTMKRARDCC
jgi:hypothetical protein